MLDFDPNRTPATPRPASTVVLLRDGDQGLEICVMQRSKQSKFMGGAVVFPGGRIEESDAPAEWHGLFSRGDGAWWDDEGIAARIAACREAFEEVGLLLVRGEAPSGTLAEIRKSKALREGLRAAELALDLEALVPLSRWCTPEAESRRFDTRFFVARAPASQTAVSDDHEATRVYWATPTSLLATFDEGSIALFPPTHRTLELLAPHRDVEAALASAREASLSTICPRFALDGDLPVLALPGDPLHEIRERRIAGKSRYVLRDGRWVSEDAR